VTDDIEVRFDDGHLTLSCGEDAFARLRAAVIAQSDAAASLEGGSDAVRYIVVRPMVVPIESSTSRYDRVALLGCGLVGFAILFLLLVGAGTLAGWKR
jgi:hypothetical protein